jgi:hypothetical protein
MLTAAEYTDGGAGLSKESAPRRQVAPTPPAPGWHVPGERTRGAHIPGGDRSWSVTVVGYRAAYSARGVAAARCGADLWQRLPEPLG